MRLQYLPRQPTLETCLERPSHELLQTNYCTRDSRKNAIVSRPLRTIASHELLHELVRDGPITTTTIIFQKSFASDATPKRHLMAHQIQNLCGFSMLHCVEGAFGASSGGTPKLKNGVPRDELKHGCGCVWAFP